MAGPSDESESGVRRAVSARVDAAQYSLGTALLGPAKRVTLNVKGGLRLRLETGVSTGTQHADGAAAFGNARLLCSGKP